MSSKTIRITTVALALAAALSAAPARAAGLPNPLAQGWKRLVHLIGAEGMGLDPNGFRTGKLLGSSGATASARPPQTAAAAAGRP